MNICVFYYDNFCEFEIALICAIFKKENVFSAALENRIYSCEGKQKFLPDKTIHEIDPKEIDLFVIPGGDPSSLYDNRELESFMSVLNENNKYISGICGGTFLMANMGVLNQKKCTGDSSGIDAGSKNVNLFNNSIILHEDVVIDGNAITATGQAFIELAVELGKLLKIYSSEEEATEDYEWLKNIKRNA